MKLKISAYAWVSFAMIVGVMGTALISPLYALYKESWHLQASDISIIYVVYMGGALCGLLFLGRLPDRVGFRPMMQCGLALALLGTFISLVAWDMASLCVGRIIMGVASSMLTTSATVGLSRLSRSGDIQRVAMMTGFLMAFGFGLGPLVGGIIGQWGPAPLVSTYVPTLFLGVLGLAALFRLTLPDYASHQAGLSLNVHDVLPRLTWPGRDTSRAFLLTCCLPFLAFGVFGLYASMAPLFLDQLLPWHGPVVSGTAIALILFASAAVQMMAGRMPTYYCGTAGLISLALSNLTLMLNLWASSAVLFALGVLLTAVGHGLCMLAGMSMVNRLATSGNRSGLLATYLVIGYIGSMIPMMGIGWIADHWGMDVAVNTFCIFVIATAGSAAVFFYRNPHMRPIMDATPNNLTGSITIEPEGTVAASGARDNVDSPRL
ncbi:MFS transporter [Pusillimonas sp. TS35]|uniref:MFS transporter n=1 Tax=Paracandidimonas lactea TaxID=2895524 RepID=UPI00136AF0CD|nr:MFS transporter [Paracandidimonas lactea]MYN12134.1 MFS transporter [Pusillimonas sp. TS35]